MFLMFYLRNKYTSPCTLNCTLNWKVNRLKFSESKVANYLALPGSPPSVKFIKWILLFSTLPSHWGASHCWSTLVSEVSRPWLRTCTWVCLELGGCCRSQYYGRHKDGRGLRRGRRWHHEDPGGGNGEKAQGQMGQRDQLRVRRIKQWAKIKARVLRAQTEEKATPVRSG